MTLFFANLVQVVFYLAVPFYVSWQVTSISLATALVFTLPLLMLGRANYRLGKLGTAAANQLSGVTQESLAMAKVILGFGNQHKSRHSLTQTFDTLRRIACKSLTLQAATPLLYEPLGLLVLVVTVCAGRLYGVPLSEIAVLLWALRSCIPLLGNLASQRNSLLNFVPSYEQIKTLRQGAVELKQPSGTRLFTGFQQGVAIEQLTFAYPGHEPVLVDVNVNVAKGTMVAIVGASGAGKSTLIDLILGFHPLTAGRVTFDGIPLEQYDINSYRQRIGYVPQDSVLFHMTIRENLRWAKEDATDAEIREACRQANADEFIERFPDGYDTMVGDRGVRLSGGECQRVALARAVLRKPELLVLDEATSSLDTSSERLIQQAIEMVAKETTVLVIAHRLSTIVNADYVYVLERGRVVEEGTYQTLVQQNGLFARMTQMQLLGTPPETAERTEGTHAVGR
jgi:ATP-binding cassette subfamily B protein